MYLVIGPPGVGKSEFVIWLASQLALPVYRLCLSSPTLTDDRLAQLLSQSSIREDAVVMQVDEFQGTLQRWLAGPGDRELRGVTAGGFCECLQGSAAMGRGVVVLSITGGIIDDQVRCQFAAVFRRVHVTAQLDWMSLQDIKQFFRQFVVRFAPDTPQQEWSYWEDRFVAEESPWNGSRPISVDMLKKYLMWRITEASCASLGTFTAGGTFEAYPNMRKQFFELLCSKEEAVAFLHDYAPVQAHARFAYHPSV